MFLSIIATSIRNQFKHELNVWLCKSEYSEHPTVDPSLCFWWSRLKPKLTADKIWTFLVKVVGTITLAAFCFIPSRIWKQWPSRQFLFIFLNSQFSRVCLKSPWRVYLQNVPWLFLIGTGCWWDPFLLSMVSWVRSIDQWTLYDDDDVCWISIGISHVKSVQWIIRALWVVCTAVLVTRTF